nr:PREDICTED: uncharacterized protein LOC105676208 [Linepithema humile]
MVMQTTLLYIFTIQFAVQLYDIFVTINTYTNYELIINILVPCTWFSSNIIKIVAFNYVCEGIYTKAKKTEMFINKLTNLTFDVETQQNITQFLLQLLRRPLRMSALGFYYFGYKFLRWIVQDTASIIIIVIQSRSNKYKKNTMLKYIGSRFEHINQHIQALIQKKKRYVRQAWATFTSSLIHRHMAGTEISQQIIWILMHIHLELCSISQDLNMIFGLQMLMQAIAFHVFTVQLVNEFYHTVTMLNYDTPNGIRIHIFIIFVWAITGIIKMVVFNYICETICNKANQTEVHLNGLTNLIFDVNTQENITQFLLQLLRKPLKISGFRLFYFGYKFVFECVNYIAMVILFVIQTHPQGPHMKEVLLNKKQL